jgi:hypothetical protein
MEHLKRHHGIQMSKGFLEKLTQMVGEFWLQRDDREAQRCLSDKVIPLAEVACDRCCVLAEGTTIHTDGDWHEVRVGTVCGSEGERRRKSSMARFGDVERFGANLWRKACQYGYRGASLKAFLGDGSHWIWNIADMHFPDAVHILDWYHLAERISQCSNELFGEATEESRQWAAGVRQIMKRGKVQQALDELEKLRVGSKNKRQAKHELITYLMNNRERVDYPRYRAVGLPIGSGEVEADCKALVQARCKQSGMRWRKKGAERVLRVRCALRDGSFHILWDHPEESITLWQKRRLRQDQRQAA